MTIFVRFRPESLFDYEDLLTVIVGDGVVTVPILAKREKWDIKWPEKVNVGHCWVGDRIKAEVPVRNTGGEAVFKIKNSDIQNGSSASYKAGFF